MFLVWKNRLKANVLLNHRSTYSMHTVCSVQCSVFPVTTRYLMLPQAQECLTWSLFRSSFAVHYKKFFFTLKEFKMEKLFHIWSYPDTGLHCTVATFSNVCTPPTF